MNDQGRNSNDETKAAVFLEYASPDRGDSSRLPGVYVVRIVSVLAAALFGFLGIVWLYLGFFTPDREMRPAAVAAALATIIFAAIAAGLFDRSARS